MDHEEFDPHGPCDMEDLAWGIFHSNLWHLYGRESTSKPYLMNFQMASDAMDQEDSEYI